MKSAQAEEMAVSALDFLVARPERLQQFLSISGLNADRLLNAAMDRQVQIGALSFVGSEEDMAREFCEGARLKPGAIEHALHILERAP